MINVCAYICVGETPEGCTKVYEVRLLAEQQPRDAIACMAAGIKVTPGADGQKARCRHMFPVTGSSRLCPIVRPYLARKGRSLPLIWHHPGGRYVSKYLAPSG